MHNPEIESTTAPLVSVVMIAYNSSRYIDRAIAGVVRQRVPFAVELIVTDDCSTDDTGERVKQWARRYPSVIRYVRNPSNLGIQRNYMAAFRLVRGRYMAMCDADDYWCDRSKLRRQAEYMEAHPECAVTFHRVINYMEDTGVKTLSNGGMPRDISIGSLSRMNYITNLSVMYRRALVDLHNLPGWLESVKLLDYAMHILYASKGTVHYSGRPMGVYRKVAGAEWSTGSGFHRLCESLKVRKCLLEEFAGDSRVVDGMRDASVAIVKAMLRTAASDSERRLAAAEALAFGLSEADCRPSGTVSAPRRSILSRLARTVSRLMPLPGP